MACSSALGPLSRRAQITVVLLLCLHTGLVGYSATRHSPTFDEPGHLVAGLAYWNLGRLDLYNVNPPLTKALAALPVTAAGYSGDLTAHGTRPGSRLEFTLGSQFVDSNGPRTICLFTLSRWSCLPISVAGGVFCFLWSRELWGCNSAGFVSLAMWCFSPNVLAHAPLITPDCAAASFGVGAGYAYWRWMCRPCWRRSAAAGVLLGLAELTKMTWIPLFIVWPGMWLAYRVFVHKKECHKHASFKQLVGIVLIAILVVNIAYGFRGSFRQLGSFSFASSALSGNQGTGQTGNRFEGTLLARMPVPFPSQYVFGADVQKRDFEKYSALSYLGGSWSDSGWWYYYIYAGAVKIPHGIQILCIMSFSIGCWYYITAHVEILPPYVGVLIIPPFLVFQIASSLGEINAHFRYVLPCFGFIFVSAGIVMRCSQRWVRALAALSVSQLIISSCWCFPHSLAYFNEAAGGSARGHSHLLGSNLDWGQDLYLLRQWHDNEGGAIPLIVYSSSFAYSPRSFGLDVHIASNFDSDAGESRPVLLAIDISSLMAIECHLRGRKSPPVDDYVVSLLSRSTRVVRVGYTIYVFECH